MNRISILLCLVSLPLRNLQLTSPFGYRIHPITGKYSFHAGIDLRAHEDTVFAVLTGKVEAAGYDPLLGIYIRLDHGEFESTYGHLSQIFIIPGDTVSARQAIAVSGATGRLTGGHLHFSVQYQHAYINPMIFLLAIVNNLKQHKKETNK